LAHVLDLRPGYDDLYHGFDNDVRRLARRARDRGLIVRRGHRVSDVKALMQLLRVSVRRWAARDGEPLALAQARLRVRDPERKFIRIVTALAPRAEIFSAWRADEPIAAALVLFGRNAHYIRGAMDAEAGNLGANHLLQTEAIAAACAAGCLRYHLGESAAGSGLARFKRNLGAEAVPFVSYRFERVPLTKLDRQLRCAVRSMLGVHGD
jgi:lipid II:glycine glycyltransferase (peptidoglycan interpeptide bridge formation enzyme)